MAAQGNPKLYLRHARPFLLSPARLLLQPPHEIHVLSDSPPRPPPTHPFPPTTTTTTFPLSVLQFSRVQSYKPAGPRRRADDTAKWAQLVLLNCGLDSYVQQDIYLSILHLFIFLLIFVKPLQSSWGGGMGLKQGQLDLMGRFCSSFAFSSEDGELLILCWWWFFGHLLFFKPQTWSQLRLAKRRGDADKLIEGQLPGLRGSFDHCYPGTTKGFLNDGAICDTLGFLLHFFIFSTEKQAIIPARKVLERRTLAKEFPERWHHPINVSPSYALK